MLNYLYKLWRPKGFCNLKQHNCISQVFPTHLITYTDYLCLRPLEILFTLYSARKDFSRTSDSDDWSLSPRCASWKANLNNLQFRSLDVVSGYRNPQSTVVENYLYLFDLIPNNCKSWCFNTHFVLNICDLNADKKDYYCSNFATYCRWLDAVSISATLMWMLLGGRW